MGADAINPPSFSQKGFSSALGRLVLILVGVLCLLGLLWALAQNRLLSVRLLLATAYAVAGMTIAIAVFRAVASVFNGRDNDQSATQIRPVRRQ